MYLSQKFLFWPVHIVTETVWIIDILKQNLSVEVEPIF